MTIARRALTVRESVAPPLANQVDPGSRAPDLTRPYVGISTIQNISDLY